MPTREDPEQVKELAEVGAVTTLIDRCFRLTQTAEAHRYVESGQKQGSVVIQCE